mmetsp:Transcript_7920/g.17477  ORF Transcript_7920/g.17477 Transcript_7920/m.17477 type:complete len:266 (+) Transcript_7920:1903-2700(+)
MSWPEMATSRHESDSRVMLQPLERSSSPSSSSGSRSTWTIAQMVLSVFSSLCSHGQSPSLIRPIIESTSWRMGAKRRKRWMSRVCERDSLKMTSAHAATRATQKKVTMACTCCALSYGAQYTASVVSVTIPVSCVRPGAALLSQFRVADTVLLYNATSFQMAIETFPNGNVDPLQPHVALLLVTFSSLFKYWEASPPSGSSVWVPTCTGKSTRSAEAFQYMAAHANLPRLQELWHMLGGTRMILPEIACRDVLSCNQSHGQLDAT